MPPTLSIVIPVYNSAQALPELVERITTALQPEKGGVELILVNDGSPDDSWRVITELAKPRPWLRGISHMRNYGQHNALLTGILEAKNEVIVTMDDDLQHPPEEIPKLLEKLAEGYDVVYGVPDTRKHGLLKNTGAWVIRGLLKTYMGTHIAEHVSAFRAIRSSICSGMRTYTSDYVLIDAILTWSTTSFGYVTIHHDARKYGKSNYNLLKSTKVALQVIVGFSVVPLQIASMMGFTFMLLGMALFGYVLWNYMAHDALQGFTFLAASLALFSGVQLFCIGIIGAYLARVHMSNMGKPYALVREKIGF